MPDSGVSGLDLFAFDVNIQRWRHVGVPVAYASTNTWSVELLKANANVTCVGRGRRRQGRGERKKEMGQKWERNGKDKAAMGCPCWPSNFSSFLVASSMHRVACSAPLFHPPLTAARSQRAALHRYLLYLPLRNSIYNGTVSVDDGSFLGGGGCAADAAPPLKRPPIVWYGTR